MKEPNLEKNTPLPGASIFARILQHPAFSYIVPVAYVLVIATVALRVHLMSDGVAETDFMAAYVKEARAFLDGRVVVDAFRGPVYPMALALTYVPLNTIFGAGC